VSSVTSVILAQRLEHWPLERLVPYSRNAKTHSIDQIDKISALILEMGFTQPILVDEADGILAGHGRLAAARKLGLELVPVVVLTHLSKAQKRAYILADNKIAEQSGWNHKLLAEELSALELEKFDFTMTGFTDRDLEQMLDELAGGAAPSRSATEPERGAAMSTDPKPFPATVTADKAAAIAKVVAAESDARTVNSTDAAGNVMRHAYRALSDTEKQAMVEIKDAGLALWNKLDELELRARTIARENRDHSATFLGARELAIAKQKAEESVMWAIKHLTA
jgi:ParB-like chromosome segregation protein Spo0J